MAKVGHLVDGKFVAVAQNFDVLNAPEATETSSGLLSATDKRKIDESYSTEDVANETEILSKIFNK